MGANHINAMDGLRGIAALAVVVSHYSNRYGFLDRYPGEGGGQIGVMLFFLISGFLMAYLYAEKPLSPASVATFYQRRFSRVIPLYLLVVLASYLLYREDLPVWFRPYPIDNDNLMDHLLMQRGVSVLWTIPVEVAFYLVFPVLWICRKLVSREVLATLCLLAAAYLFVEYGGAGRRLNATGHYFLIGAALGLL